MIFWVNPDDPCNKSISHYTTAFYIGSDTVVTVAHNFEGRLSDESTPVFVPAMIDKNDIEGRNFGVFILDDIYIHTEFNSSKDYTNDICIAKIIAGSEGTKTLKRPCLQLTNNSQLEDGTFQVFGYRCFEQVIGSEKMIKFCGTFVQNFKECVYIPPVAYRGMSGGPWIQGEDKVVGMQSTRKPTSRPPTYSSSPIFSNKILDDIAVMQQIYNKNLQTSEGRNCFQLIFSAKTKEIHFRS